MSIWFCTPLLGGNLKTGLAFKCPKIVTMSLV